MVERTVQTPLGEVRVSRTVREKVSKAAGLVADHPLLKHGATRALHKAGVTAILEGRTKVTGVGTAATHIDAFLIQAENYRQRAYVHKVSTGNPLTMSIDIETGRAENSIPMPDTLPRHIRRGIKRLAGPYSTALHNLGVPDASVDSQTQRLVDTKAEAAAGATDLSHQVLIAQGIIEMVTGMPTPRSVMERFAEPNDRTESSPQQNSEILLHENVPLSI